jgi:hypothetical protein
LSTKTHPFMVGETCWWFGEDLSIIYDDFPMKNGNHIWSTIDGFSYIKMRWVRGFSDGFVGEVETSVYTWVPKTSKHGVTGGYDRWWLMISLRIVLNLIAWGISESMNLESCSQVDDWLGIFEHIFGMD